MKITRLHISNFLKLKDVDLNPSKTNVIVGKNKQGKTSIIKAIQSAFEGKIDPSAIRLGEDKAEIIIEMDALTIKRTVTSKTSSLDVSNAEGMKYPAPQKFLDGLIGTFSFNPIEFFNMKPADQKKYLLEAVRMTITPEELAVYTGEQLTGINYEAHALEVVAAAHKYYYDQRTVMNAEVSKKRKALDELKGQLPADFKPAEFSADRLTDLRKAVTDNEVTKSEKLGLLNRKQALLDELASIDNKLELMPEIIETDALEAEIAQLERNRDLMHTHKQCETVANELSTAATEQVRLDTAVKKLSKEVPQMLITKAELPVQGLSVDENGITINGVALDNLSGAEQLGFALAIVRELNKEFGIICIDGIESLDREAFEAFMKEAEADDYQYFVSRVDGDEADKKGYILVEDGEVKVPTTDAAVQS